MVHNLGLCGVCQMCPLPSKILSELLIISRTSGPYLKLLTSCTPLPYSCVALILPGEATQTVPPPSIVLSEPFLAGPEDPNTWATVRVQGARRGTRGAKGVAEYSPVRRRSFKLVRSWSLTPLPILRWDLPPLPASLSPRGKVPLRKTVGDRSAAAEGKCGDEAKVARVSPAGTVKAGVL